MNMYTFNAQEDTESVNIEEDSKQTRLYPELTAIQKALEIQGTIPLAQYTQAEEILTMLSTSDQFATASSLSDVQSQVTSAIEDITNLGSGTVDSSPLYNIIHNIARDNDSSNTFSALTTIANDINNIAATTEYDTLLAQFHSIGSPQDDSGIRSSIVDMGNPIHDATNFTNYSSGMSDNLDELLTDINEVASTNDQSQVYTLLHGIQGNGFSSSSDSLVKITQLLNNLGGENDSSKIFTLLNAALNIRPSKALSFYLDVYTPLTDSGTGYNGTDSATATALNAYTNLYGSTKSSIQQALNSRKPSDINAAVACVNNLIAAFSSFRLALHNAGLHITSTYKESQIYNILQHLKAALMLLKNGEFAGNSF